MSQRLTSFIQISGKKMSYYLLTKVLRKVQLIGLTFETKHDPRLI